MGVYGIRVGMTLLSLLYCTFILRDSPKSKRHIQAEKEKENEARKEEAKPFSLKRFLFSTLVQPVIDLYNVVFRYILCALIILADPLMSA